MSEVTAYQAALKTYREHVAGLRDSQGKGYSPEEQTLLLIGFGDGLRHLIPPEPDTIERMAYAMARTYHAEVLGPTEPWDERQDWKIPRALYEAMARGALSSLYSEKPNEH